MPLTGWMDDNLRTQGYRLPNLCLPSVAMALWERRHHRKVIHA